MPGGSGQRQVTVEAGPVRLPGLLGVPEALAGAPMGAVIFAHGSGSSRLSPRNNAVAEELRRAGLGTLLFDLLTEEEAADRQKVFDIDLLAERLSSATEWLRGRSDLERVPLGYFGASTGAAAALQAAASLHEAHGDRQDVQAVVSRGGRPDLAEPFLPQVRAPTLLIVGELDHPVVGMNRRAYEQLGGDDKELRLVPGATHLFEEPGALEEVTRLARQWFLDHLG